LQFTTMSAAATWRSIDAPWSTPVFFIIRTTDSVLTHTHTPAFNSIGPRLDGRGESACQLHKHVLPRILNRTRSCRHALPRPSNR
jgi:hypothetical protein